jgi:type I restriction enzyme, S subunit
LNTPSCFLQHEQKAVAHILGTLDDKIELNRKTNETLEAMAKALFKSWFVDFDPVRAKVEGRSSGLPAEISDLFPDSFEDSELGEIPNGWEVKALDEIAHFLNGLALQKFPPEDGAVTLPVIKIAQLKKGDSTERQVLHRCSIRLCGQRWRYVVLLVWFACC